MRFIHIFTVLLVLSIPAYSQSFPLREGKIYYQFIDSVPKSETEIYNRSMTWIASRYKNSKAVTRLDNKENGEYIGKGNFRFSMKAGIFNYSGVIEYTFRLTARDNKYREEWYDFKIFDDAFRAEHDMNEYRHLLKPRYHQRFVDEVDEQIHFIHNDMNAYIKKTDNF